MKTRIILTTLQVKTSIFLYMKRTKAIAITLVPLLFMLLASCSTPFSSSPPSGDTPEPNLPQTYMLTTSVIPADGGYISPTGGQYTEGSQLTLTAVPATGYVFDYWEGKLWGSLPTVSIIMDSDKSVTAHFQPVPPQTPPSLPTVIQEAPQSTELLNRHYSWVYNGKEWTWELQIPEALYTYYQEIPRPPTENYSVYVTHPSDDTYVDFLTGKLRETAQQEGFDKLRG